MPRLPDVTDYGARPAISTGRRDPVHPEGLEVAEAVTNAARVFAQIYSDKQQKDSRINYALAKNEIMKLDLQTRRSLDERQDFENFDQAYTEAFTAGIDEITGRHFDRISPDDRLLLTSEIDLIRERGRVEVGAAAKALEVDLGQSSVTSFATEALDNIHMETSQERRNELILQVLETFKAAEENGWFTAQETEAALQTFVASAAEQFLNNMDPNERLAELEYAREWRQRNGVIDRENLAQGQGSGSMGDYLPSYVLDKMIRDTREVAAAKNIADVSVGIVDSVMALRRGTESDDIEAQRDMSIQMLDETIGKDDENYGEYRQALLDELKERQAYEGAIVSAQNSEALAEMTNMIDQQVTDGKVPTIADLRGSDIWPELSIEGRAAAERYVALRAEGDGYSLADDDDFLYEWDSMTPAEKVEYFESAAFNSAETKTRVTRATWESMAAEATAHRDSRDSSRPQRPDIYAGDAQDRRILMDMMIGENKIFTRDYSPGDPSVQARRQRRIEAAVNRALVDESTRRWHRDGSGWMSPQEKRQIIGEILSQEIYVRESNVGIDYLKGDRRTIEAEVIRFDTVQVRDRNTGNLVTRAIDITLEPEALEAYIPIETWRTNPSASPRMNVQPGESQFLTMEEYLRNLAPAGSDPSDRDLEEAYFYLNALPEIDGIDYAIRRLAGEEGF